MFKISNQVQIKSMVLVSLKFGELWQVAELESWPVSEVRPQNLQLVICSVHFCSSFCLK
jgi:hypothetical protein